MGSHLYARLILRNKQHEWLFLAADRPVGLKRHYYILYIHYCRPGEIVAIQHLKMELVHTVLPADSEYAVVVLLSQARAVSANSSATKNGMYENLVFTCY